MLLDGGPDAVPEARRAVLAAQAFIPRSVRDDLLLLVTEVVTNAVRHGGVGPDQSVRVALRPRNGLVRVEVVDPGKSFTRAEVSSSRGGKGGWGLFIVDQIATRWGVTPVATGTSVWFEL